MRLVTQEYEEWALTVKKMLIDRRMSVMQLAKNISIHKASVSATINCSMPKVEVVKRISDYLGIAYPGEESAS